MLVIVVIYIVPTLLNTNNASLLANSKSFIIRQLTEKYLEKDRKIYAALIDMEKVYDKVWRTDLWVTLKGYGVRGKLLGSIKALYKESKACVRVEGEVTEEFMVEQGLYVLYV